MTKSITSVLLALLGTANINCTPSQQAEHPQKPDCSSINLQEKVGFVGKLSSEDGDICYKILPRFNEYIGFCEPRGRTKEYFRVFAGPNKGEMEMNHISDFLGSHAYTPSVRSPSGKIHTLTSIPIPELEKAFKDGAEMLDLVKNIPHVCKELQEYKKN